MNVTRRQFTAGLGACAAASLLSTPARALIASPQATGASTLSFLQLHTGEKGRFTYRENGTLIPEEMARLNHLLRDHRTGAVHAIDPHLLDLLHLLQRRTGSRQPFQIISAYRSSETNAMLAAQSGGVAKKSLHMTGQAIDIALADIPLNKLHSAALKMRAGGVGYYPGSGFIHVDTGPVRRW